MISQIRTKMQDVLLDTDSIMYKILYAVKNRINYLVYDLESTHLFCVTCAFYAQRLVGTQNYLCTTGLLLCIYAEVNKTVKRHENSEMHKKAYVEYNTSCSATESIDPLTILNEEKINRNRYIAEHIIQAIMFVITNGGKSIHIQILEIK